MNTAFATGDLCQFPHERLWLSGRLDKRLTDYQDDTLWRVITEEGEAYHVLQSHLSRG